MGAGLKILSISLFLIWNINLTARDIGIVKTNFSSSNLIPEKINQSLLLISNFEKTPHTNTHIFKNLKSNKEFQEDYWDSFNCNFIGNKLNQQFHFSLGIKIAFLKFKGGMIDYTSSFLDYDNLTTNCIAYEGSLGLGFEAKLSDNLSIHPDLTFWDYQIARYGDISHLSTDFDYFKISYWYSKNIRLSVGFRFGSNF